MYTRSDRNFFYCFHARFETMSDTNFEFKTRQRPADSKRVERSTLPYYFIRL